MAMARTENVDLLIGLLRTEQAGVLRYLAQADPYMNFSAATLRRPLRKMLDAEMRREGELAELITDMGGTIGPASLSPEYQYMAYLSVGYLLPKLVQAKEATIARYEQTLGAMEDASTAELTLLKTHLAELKEELAAMQGMVVPEEE